MHRISPFFLLTAIHQMKKPLSEILKGGSWRAEVMPAIFLQMLQKS